MDPSVCSTWCISFCIINPTKGRERISSFFICITYDTELLFFLHVSCIGDESHFCDSFSVELKFQYVVKEAYGIDAFCICSAWLSILILTVFNWSLCIFMESVKRIMHLLMNSPGLSTASLEIVDPGNELSTGL